MEFTFNSKSLEREVSLHQIYELTPSEARNLHAELVIAVQSMDERVAEALASEHASGIPADKDWIHRVKKKRRICVAFATQVKQMLDAPQQQAAPAAPPAAPAPAPAAAAPPVVQQAAQQVAAAFGGAVSTIEDEIPF